MRARLLLNLALLVVIVGLAALVIYRPGASLAGGVGASIPITHVSPREIRLIRINAGHGRTVKLERGKSGWQLLQPVRFAADDRLIRRLLRGFSEPSKKHFARIGHKLANYGLANPSLKVWLDEREIDFGDTNPLSGARYILVDKIIYLARDSLYGRLDVAPLTFVRKRLLPDGARISAIHLPNLSVIRAQQGGWQTKPAGPHAGRAVRQLVDAWQGAYANRVSAATAKQKSHAGRPIRITLAGGKKTVTFNMLKTEHELDLLRPSPGLVFHLVANSRERLLNLVRPTSKSAARAGSKSAGHPLGGSG